MGEERNLGGDNKGPDAIDRRGDPRLGIAAKVKLHGEAAWSGFYSTSDLSRSGAFLISDDPPPRGAVVSLDLELGRNWSVADLSALVVHTRSEASEPSARGCGIMFLRLTEDQAGTIERILTELESNRNDTRALDGEDPGDLVNGWKYQPDPDEPEN